MGFFSEADKQHAERVLHVPLTKYSGAQAHHDELDHLINDADVGDKEHIHNEIVAGANRVTVIVSSPEGWGESFTSHPGHCGVVLWNNATREFQSCGIHRMSEDDPKGYFVPEAVNAKAHIIKADPKFKIWYFTADCDSATYKKMQARIDELYKKSVDATKIGYGKFLVIRAKDHSFSCVTGADTILAAGGPRWSVGLASQTSTPWAYTQTFTSAGWHISYAAGHKQC